MNMKTALRCSLTALALGLLCTVCSAQTDKKEVRAGNRLFNKEKWQEADIEYRKATAKDSLSFAAWYNLAGAQYREGAFDEAAKSLEKIKDAAPASASASAADYYYNLGNIAVQKKDWKAAVDAYKQSLLIDPEDMDTKENYSYARQMLKNEGGGGGGQNNQNDQNQNQDQDQNGQNQDNSQDQNNQGDNNDQNQDQNQGQNNPDQNKGDGQGEGQAEAKLSPQQAQGMLKAIQAREKETQDKVNKEKAALLKSRQKEKNW